MKLTAPAMKTINGKQCVRVLDLAKEWDTTTSNILCASKPYHIPEKYLHRIDGRVWCELEGLRYRSTATSKSRLTRHIVEFLDSLEKPTVETEPATTDLDAAALIADARRTASQALSKANEAVNSAHDASTLAKANSRSIGKLGIRLYDVEADVYSSKHDTRRDHVARHQSANATVVSDRNTERIDDLTNRVHDLDERAKALEHDVPQLLHAMVPKERVQKLSGKLDHLADMVNGNLLGGIAENAAAIHVAKDTASKTVDTATQAADLAQENADIMRGEIERLTKQEKRIDKLEKHARAVDWTLAAVAMLSVVGHVIHLLRRR